MFRRTLPLAVFSLTLAATSADAVAPREKKSQAFPTVDPGAEFSRPNNKELLREAKDLWLIQEDFTGALAKFNAAVTADPHDHDARLQRAHFFEVLSHIVIAADRPKFEERAKADFEHIVGADPESMIAGVARDGLTRLNGEPFVAVKTVTCPSSAADVHGRANALYAARRYAEAVVEYGRATEGCPENAGWWVELADSFYELEDYDRAKVNFIKALAVDRWNREAHRYLSDTYVQLGDHETAVRELMLAVVSDPTYEAGWSALRAYGTAMGHKWNRVHGDRRSNPSNPDRAGWVAYEAAKAGARKTLGVSASALAMEREGVKAALRSGALGPFWSMMAAAEQGGHLDEAIFLHLLDAALGVEYPAFRDKNATRLATYMETLVLP